MTELTKPQLIELYKSLIQKYAGYAHHKNPDFVELGRYFVAYYTDKLIRAERV